MKCSGLGGQAELRRIKNLQASARDRKVQRGKSQLHTAFVGPTSTGREVNNFDRELGRVLAGARLGKWQKKAGVRAGAGTNGFAGERRAPQRGAWRQSDFYEAALIVTQGVAGFDQRFSVLGKEHAVAGFLDIGHENRLLGVARDREMQRTLQFGVVGMSAKCKQRG